MDPNREIIYYTDYRKFLKDYYTTRKAQVKGFTYQVFAQKAGFSAASFLKMVIDGKKNLTKTSCAQVAEAMHLTKKSTEYFTCIVGFTQEKSIERKKEYLAKIDRYRKKNVPEIVLPGEYDYLRHWLHAVVREMVELKDFKEDPEMIAQRLHYGVRPEDVKKSLEFLLQHGFLTRNLLGRLKKKDKTLSTGDIPHNEELELIARQYHLQSIQLAQRAVSELPKDSRNVVSGTFSMSQKNYESACKRIQNLFYELLEMGASDEGADQVFQLNINLFPMSRSCDD